MNPTTDLSFELILVLSGASLGIATSYLTQRIVRRNEINAKIMEIFIQIRTDIGVEVGGLYLFKGPCDSTEINKFRDNIGKLYFKYSHFLPTKVKNEFHCLFACINDLHKNNYIPEKKGYRKLDYSSTKDISEFIDKISLTWNFSKTARYCLSERHSIHFQSTCLRYQALSLLKVFDECFNFGYINKLYHNVNK
jgi:hypothetical protein